MTELERGVAAAAEIVRAHGLSGDDPVVLGDGANLLVRLGPVVARVATTTAVVRPDVADHFARDVAVRAHLAARGVPVVPSPEDVPPGPHLSDGLVVTLAGHVEHDPAWTPAPAEFAACLAELHDGLLDFPGALPDRLPLTDVDRVLALLDADDLRERRDELAAEWDRRWTAARPLHGDAHPGNLLLAPSGPVWNDLEDTWRGPVEWDLAGLANTGRLDGRAGIAAHPAEFDAEALAYFVGFRRLHAECWRRVLAAS
ncbi:aminoglycoside phosphotransferase family protein [Umezawaea beigongshangensis]|uniref:aminoglycoside phosphotransferase family protein n=1 Tax=Umezawaea beigongshangensis TaxID=2780383 RepID=UPI0018F13EFE|nr:aminoglycoside phosphotransferase family protein [Umezawaea beigongshangensis]